MDRYTQPSESGCWEWTGALNNRGYGIITISKSVYYTHRVSYTRYNGPIPDGHVLDHLCRNTKCANPEHLEAVSDKINTRRGYSNGAVAQRREACLYGHLYSEHGRQYGPRRVCLQCARDKSAARRAQQKP
jgi:HNH endonuclease